MKKRKKYLYFEVGLNSHNPYIAKIRAADFGEMLRSMLSCFDSGSIIKIENDGALGFRFVSDIENVLILRVPFK